MRNHLWDLLTLAAGVAVAAVLLWAGLATRPDPATMFRGSVSSLQDAAGFAAAAGGLAVALWWIIGMILAGLFAALHKAGHAAAAAKAGALAPAFMKRLAAAAIGLNLVSGMGAAQAAESFSPESPPQSIAALQEPISGLGAETADQGSGPPSPHWKPRASPSTGNVFIRPGRSDAATQAVVRAGDSLWSLAAAQLGPQATDAEVAAHWPRWYERNRTVIGEEPHLIFPGQIFEVPDLPPEKHPAPSQPAGPDAPEVPEVPRL